MDKKGYSITIQDLLERPIVRNDFEEEWMNKMTDKELSQFERESYQLCIEDGTPEKYPDINAACLSKHIDRTIFYKLKLSGYKPKRHKMYAEVARHVGKLNQGLINKKNEQHR